MRDLSIVICTRNPDLGTLDRCLDSVAFALRLAVGLDSEVILVDNGSYPPLCPRARNGFNEFSIIQEAKPGVFSARKSGINEARGRWVLFVDDDNELDPDYVVAGFRFLENHPMVGVLGGRISLPQSLSEGVTWQTPCLDLLAIRDFGDNSFVEDGDGFSASDPPTAGMFILREIAEMFFAQNWPESRALGRDASGLYGGEDSMLVFFAKSKSYQIGYSAELRMDHWVGARRLKFFYLLRLSHSMGRSHAVIRHLTGLSTKRPRAISVIAKIPYHLFRWSRKGIRFSMIRTAWKFGYNWEARCP